MVGSFYSGKYSGISRESCSKKDPFSLKHGPLIYYRLLKLPLEQFGWQNIEPWLKLWYSPHLVNQPTRMPKVMSLAICILVPYQLNHGRRPDVFQGGTKLKTFIGKILAISYAALAIPTEVAPTKTRQYQSLRQ